MNVPESLRIVIPVFAYPASLTVLSLGTNLGAHIISKNKQKQLSEMCCAMSGTLSGYKHKIEERFGKETSYEIEKSITENARNKSESITQKVWFYEPISKTYFRRTEIEVLEAEYHTNKNFALKQQISLNEFYAFLGIPRTKYGDKVGWNQYLGEIDYGYIWIDFAHRKAYKDDGGEYTIIDYPFIPTPDYLDG